MTEAKQPKQERMFLVAMRLRRPGGKAVCVDDGDAWSSQFRAEYAGHEIRRVPFDEMKRLMTTD